MAATHTMNFERFYIDRDFIAERIYIKWMGVRLRGWKWNSIDIDGRGSNFVTFFLQASAAEHGENCVVKHFAELFYAWNSYEF